MRAKRPHRTTNAAFSRRIGNPVKNETTIFLVGVNFRDITEQTEISAELRRILQEFQHREKNMLANVLALVSRARRDAGADIAVLDTLAARISALAHTHKVFTRENWRAAGIFALLQSAPTLLSIGLTKPSRF